MADDIYINTGTTFQQQYTARVPANAQQPVSGQVPARQPAQGQNPFTYANRNPFTYRSPVVNQSPYIASAQQPYPYPANAQTPFIGQARQPSTYARQGRTPAIYQHPFTYARQAQTPAIYQHPTTYARQGQTPSTYSNRQPFTYSNRQPAIYQNPYPFIGQARQPSTYNHRTPQVYRQPRSGSYPRTYPYIAAAQTPYIANAQAPYPYIANAQAPYIANRQNAYPYIANAQTPYSNQNTSSNNVVDTDSTSAPVGGNVDMATLDWKHTTNQYISAAYAELIYKIVVIITGTGATATQEIIWQIKRGNDSFSQMIVNTFHSDEGNVTLGTSNRDIATQLITGEDKFADSAGWISDATYPKLENETHSGSGAALHTETDSGAAMDTFHDVTSHLNNYSCTHRLNMTLEESGYTTVDLNWIWTPTLRKAGFPDLSMDAKHNAFVQGWITSSFCFPAGSQVLLENNTTKNIESMVVGDRVIGQDGVINEVIELVTTEQRERTLHTINGDIQTVPQHPFLTTTGWKAIDATAAAENHPSLNITQLAIGDFVVKTANNGTVSNEEVTTLTSATENIIVYNLDVTDSPAGNDTYVVNNYVVHNK